MPARDPRHARNPRSLSRRRGATSLTDSSETVDREPTGPARATGRPLRLVIRADGAARGNPGPAAAGAVLIDADSPNPLDPDAPPIAVIARPLGIRTNNVAEYAGIVLALRKAHKLGTREVDIRLDSKLLVEQLNGRWRIRHPGLVGLNKEAQELLRGFDRVTVRHEPRAMNRAADALANLALDDPDRAAELERAVAARSGIPVGDPDPRAL